MGHTLNVSIFGNTYTLQSDGNDKQIIEVAAYVDRKMTELSQRSSISSPTNIAILVALNLANELMDVAKEETENEKNLQGIENLIMKVKQAYVQM